MTPAKLRFAQAGMGKPETKVAELYPEFGITRQTLYRHVTPKGRDQVGWREVIRRRN